MVPENSQCSLKAGKAIRPSRVVLNLAVLPKPASNKTSITSNK